MNADKQQNKGKNQVNEMNKKLHTVFHKISEAYPNLKQIIDGIKIEKAEEIVVDERNKCLLIQVDESSYPNVQKIHKELVKSLEDQFSTPVVLVPNRKIVNGNNFRRYVGKRAPRAKTLTATFSNALEDVLHPATILGMRTRFSRGGNRLFKVFVDSFDKEAVGYKTTAISASYKHITKRSLEIEFLQGQAPTKTD
jgi:hypothetical protein